MRALFAIVILAALGWSGWWYVQAHARETALRNWLVHRREAGWVAEVDDLHVTGFPSRIDAMITGLDLADPRQNWSWHADGLQILSLSYKPNHLIAALPGEQVVSTPLERIEAQGDTLRGSVVLEPTPRLALDHSTFEIGNLRISSDAGWGATIGKAILATRQADDPDHPFAHDVALDAEHLALPADVAAELDPGHVLPAEISHLSLDTTLDFDKAWDRPALEDGDPVLEQLRIREIAVTWGRLDLRGRGTLDVDDEGYAEGRVDLVARNWQKMLEVAVAAGALDPSLAGAVKSGLELLSRFSGGDGALKVPLDFSDRRVRLGPIVIGEAPRLARLP